MVTTFAKWLKVISVDLAMLGLWSRALLCDRIHTALLCHEETKKKLRLSNNYQEMKIPHHLAVLQRQSYGWQGLSSDKTLGKE